MTIKAKVLFNTHTPTPKPDLANEMRFRKILQNHRIILIFTQTHQQFCLQINFLKRESRSSAERSEMTAQRVRVAANSAPF